jgi:hypothetical protein
MKFWLTKFKISNALNDRKPLSPAIGRAIDRSEELRRFTEQSSTLDHALKNQLPKPGASAPLHASIMRAVRAAGPTPVAENQRLWPGWISVSSLATVVILSVFLAIQFFDHPESKVERADSSKVERADSPPLTAASSALELGGRLAREAPAAALSPLSDEMQRLDRDLFNTGQFLLASLP